MAKKTNRLTKVAKGIAFGDVSNIAVRNILTQISKALYNDFTDEDMEKTMEYFDWCCPYTGDYLKADYDAKNGNYATDHIYPQNRIWCGLNVKGNLILVSKKANVKKASQSVKDFLLNDKDVLGDLDDKIRYERLAKIDAFQKTCGYDAEIIKNTISDMMKKRYEEVRRDQEVCIENALDALKANGIPPKNTTIPTAGYNPPKTSRTTKSTDKYESYLTEDCGFSKTVAASYKSHRNKIMRELEFSDILDLEKHIDEAIDFCTKGIESAKKVGNEKKKKVYNDCRSALRKYKDYMEANESTNS
jgi:hypothetical protein